MDLAKVGVRVVAEGVDQAKSDLESTSSALNRFADKASSLGQKLSLGVTAPLVGLGTKAFFMASDVEESLNKVQVVFGEGAAAIESFAATAADKLGMSRAAALDAQGTFGNLFTTMKIDASSLGVPIGDLAGKLSGLNAEMLNTMDPTAALSTSMVTLASDLSSFTNIPIEEVFAALQSGLVGETEPLRRFGILINEDRLQMKALELGIWDGTGAMSEQAKVAARAAIILEDSANAHGDAANTADSAANSWRRFQAQLSDFMVLLGNQVLPTGTKLIQWGIKLVSWLADVDPRFLRIAVIVGAVVAAMGPLLIIVGQVAAGIAALMPVLSALGPALAILTGPIGLIVLALAALAAAYATNFLGIRDIVNGAVGAVVDKISELWDALTSNPTVIAVVTAAMKGLAAIIENVSDSINRAVNVYNKWRRQGLNPLSAALRAFGRFLETVADGFEPLDRVLERLGQTFSEVARTVQAILEGDWARAWLHGRRAIESFIKYIFELHTIIPRLLMEVFSRINWGAVASSVADGARNVFDGIVSAVEAIPFGDIGQALLTGFLLAIDALAGWAQDLFDRLSDWVSGIDWVQLLVTVASAMLTAGRDLIDNLIQGAQDFWDETASGWFGDLPGKITGALDAVADFATLLMGRGWDLLDGLADGAEDAWDSINRWLGGVPEAVLKAIGDLGETLFKKGWDLLYGLYLGAIEFWNDWVVPWLNRVGPEIVSSVGELIRTLFQKGKDLIQGFRDGIDEVWEGIASFFSGIRDTIAGWIPDDIGSVFDPLVTAFNKVGEAAGLAQSAIQGVGGFLGFGGDGGEEESQQQQQQTTQAPQAGIQPMLLEPPDFSAITRAAEQAGREAGERYQQAFAEGLITAAKSYDVHVNLMGTKFDAFVRAAGNAGLDAGVDFHNEIVKKFGLAHDNANIKLDNIQRSLGLFTAQVKAFGTAAGNNFADGIQSGMNRAVGATVVGVARIVAAMRNIGSLYGDGFRIGASLGDGLAAGIASRINAVAQAAANLVGSAITAAQQRAQTASPSRVMAELGENMSLGLAQGISAALTAPVQAMTNVVDAVTGLGGRMSGSASVNTGEGLLAGRGQVVNNIYTLTSEEFQRLLKNSETGVGFATSMSFQTALRYPGRK